MNKVKYMRGKNYYKNNFKIKPQFYNNNDRFRFKYLIEWDFYLRRYDYLSVRDKWNILILDYKFSYSGYFI